MWDNLSQKNLTLDQTSTPLEMERLEVEQFYYPLALRLLERSRGQKRILAAVAGPPGSGKTAFATLLVAVINAEAQGEELPADAGKWKPGTHMDRTGGDIKIFTARVEAVSANLRPVRQPR